jgi:muramoyltetrapeptide carboxypeptidase
MLTPPRPLARNGHVVVLAISSPSEMTRIQAGVRALEQRGLRVTLADNIDHRYRGFLAGTDDERLEQLNHYLRSDDVDAFFFARGGYGAMRILDRIDYDAITANPRPIIGFSDITALHQAVAVRCGVGSFHGPMVNLDWFEGLTPDIEQWFWSMLAGDAPLTHSFDASQIVFGGEAESVRRVPLIDDGLDLDSVRRLD